MDGKPDHAPFHFGSETPNFDHRTVTPIPANRNAVVSRKSSPWSCGLAVVVVEHSAETRSTPERSRLGRGGVSVLDQLTAQPLMKPFGVVVNHEFLDDVSEMSFVENDEVIQALVLDGFDEPLRMRVAVWALRRNPHALHPAFPQDS